MLEMTIQDLEIVQKNLKAIELNPLLIKFNSFYLWVQKLGF